MTVSQFFVYKRPVAWSLLVVTVAWGLYSYSQMPQRRIRKSDPQRGHHHAVPRREPDGGRAAGDAEDREEDDREPGRRGGSIRSAGRGSRWSSSPCSTTVRNAEPVWQDLAAKLDVLDDLPAVAGQSLKPKLDKDFGDTGRGDADAQQPAGVGLRDRRAGADDRGRRKPLRARTAPALASPACSSTRPGCPRNS